MCAPRSSGRALAPSTPNPTLRQVLATTNDSLVALIALNTVVYVRDVLGFAIELTRDDVRATGDGTDRRLEYLTNPR